MRSLEAFQTESFFAKLFLKSAPSSNFKTTNSTKAEYVARRIALEPCFDGEAIQLDQLILKKESGKIILLNKYSLITNCTLLQGVINPGLVKF